mmetsp:Transcript_75143/g.244326  ORF Transcript_75143/g.244326 Transcript_75143/m.244326 type:complete len:387 (-) Transcript_75143:1031-2191(-)
MSSKPLQPRSKRSSCPPNRDDSTCSCTLMRRPQVSGSTSSSRVVRSFEKSIACLTWCFSIRFATSPTTGLARPRRPLSSEEVAEAAAAAAAKAGCARRGFRASTGAPPLAPSAAGRASAPSLAPAFGEGGSGLDLPSSKTSGASLPDFFIASASSTVFLHSSLCTTKASEMELRCNPTPLCMLSFCNAVGTGLPIRDSTASEGAPEWPARLPMMPESASFLGFFLLLTLLTTRDTTSSHSLSESPRTTSPSPDTVPTRIDRSLSSSPSLSSNSSNASSSVSSSSSMPLPPSSQRPQARRPTSSSVTSVAPYRNSPFGPPSRHTPKARKVSEIQACSTIARSGKVTFHVAAVFGTEKSATWGAAPVHGDMFGASLQGGRFSAAAAVL